MDNNAVVMADAEGVIRFWSPGAEAAFGHAAEAAVGRTLDLIVPPDLQAMHWAGFRKAIASGEAAVEGQTGPFPVRRADGEVVPTAGTLALVRNGTGGVIGALVVFD